MNKIYFLLFVAAQYCGEATAQDRTPMNNFREMGGFAAPESVVFGGDFVFVSNVGASGKATAKDGDGFISKVSKGSGMMVRRDWATGLNSPKGMVVIKNTLYVTDIDKVLGFDLKTAKQVFSLDLADTKSVFINDIAVKDNGTLFVSASDINAIFVININKKSYEKLAIDAPKGVNGLCYEAQTKTLWLNSMGESGNGELGRVTDLSSDPTYETISSARKGTLDGLQIPEKGLILYSDWGAPKSKRGVILRYDTKTEMSRPVPLHRTFGGPADFIFDNETACFYIPLMTENKLWIEQVAGILTDVDIIKD